MALSIGELAGYLSLDAGPFEQGIGAAMDALGSKKWSTAANVAGAAAGAALGAGLMGAIDTDASVRKMNASMGLAGPEAEKAGKIAGNLYSQAYGESMDDVTAATSAVMSSIPGLMNAPAAEIEGMTAKVLDLATAFELDTGRAAQVAGQMITTGLAKDGAHAADLLTAALQKVPANLREDLVDAADEYGPFFSSMGIQGEQAMGMLVKASEDGMYGIDKTGDAIKEFSIRATDMSKASGEAYKALGLDQEQMTADLLAGGDKGAAAFQKIVGGLQGMKDPVAQSQAALALFGTPLEDLSVTEIPKFLGGLTSASEGLGGVAGAAGKMGETLNGGPAVALTEFRRTAEMSLQGVAAAALPILQPIIDLMTRFAPILGPLAVGLAAFAGAIWLVNAAMKAWTIVQLIMNAALWTSPITWIIAGVIALIAVIWLIVANWEQISAWLMSAGATFAAWWNAFWGQIGAWISTVWGGFINWIKAAWAGFSAWLVGAGAAISAWWNGLWSGIGSFVSTVWNNIVAWVQSAWNTLVAWIMGALTAYVSFWIGIWTGIGQALADAWNNMVAWAQDGWNAIKSGVEAFGTGLVSFLADTWNNVTSGISGFIDGAIQFFSDLPGNILAALGNLGNLLVNAGDQILQGFLDGLRNGFEAVKDFIGGIGDWIAENKGPKQYDLGLLVPAGGWIMDGLNKGIQDSMPGLGSTLGDVSWMIANGIDPEVTGSGSYAFSGAGAGAATAGQAVTVNVTVNEASNAKETGRLVVSKLGHALAGQGVKLGKVDFDS